MSLLTQLCYLPYRVIRRIGTADVSCVFGIELKQLRPEPLPARFDFVELSSQRLEDLIPQHPQLFSETQANHLADKRAYCFCVFDGETLVGYAWLATGSIPAHFNHSGDSLTGLPIELSADTGFIYNVFVFPEYRGMRIYGALMNEAARSMHDRGVTRLLLTTDVTNEKSLKALRRMGFQDLGRAWLFRLGPFSVAHYPTSPVFGSVRIGRYTGDGRAESSHSGSSVS